MLIRGVDLDTRSGLKKVHANFPDIYQRLSGLYEANLQSDNITGGVIGIFAKMSADSILRDKLFEKGITAFILSSPLMKPELIWRPLLFRFFEKAIPAPRKEAHASYRLGRIGNYHSPWRLPSPHRDRQTHHDPRPSHA